MSIYSNVLYRWLLPRAIEVVGNNMKQFHLFTKDNMLTF